MAGIFFFIMYEIYCSWLQEYKMIVNLLTLKQSFETCVTFRPASIGIDPFTGIRVAHVSILQSKVRKFTINIYDVFSVFDELFPVSQPKTRLNEEAAQRYIQV